MLWHLLSSLAAAILKSVLVEKSFNSVWVLSHWRCAFRSDNICLNDIFVIDTLRKLCFICTCYMCSKWFWSNCICSDNIWQEIFIITTIVIKFLVKTLNYCKTLCFITICSNSMTNILTQFVLTQFVQHNLLFYAKYIYFYDWKSWYHQWNLLLRNCNILFQSIFHG